MGTQKVDQLKKGEKFEVSGFEISGLTLGNNIIEVFVDPEGVLNKKDTQDYFYRIIYAYSTR